MISILVYELIWATRITTSHTQTHIEENDEHAKTKYNFIS